jgi:hypothetical protein
MMNAINCKVMIKEPIIQSVGRWPRQLERIIPKQMAGIVKES